MNEQKLRILQFSDSFLPIMDGVGNVVYQYARCFGEKGNESYVCAPQTDTGYRGGWPFELIDYSGTPLRHMKSYNVGAPLLDPHCIKRLNMIQPDVVHVHSPFIAGQAGLDYAQKRGLPVVGTFHSRYYDDFLQVTGVELLAEVGVKYVVNFFERCSEVWAVSASSADTLRGYGFTGDIKVMPNGTDVRVVDPKTVRDTSVRFGLSGEPVLLFVGQMNWKKNIRCILEACAKLRGGFRLVFAGQGPHEKEIRELAASLLPPEKVVYTGHISERKTLDALYALADLFLFPSLYDTSGLVVREAAAAKTPSVVVRGSSAAECIRDGENGLLCENDPEDLARVVEAALNNPETLRRMGECARETIPIPWNTLVDDVLTRYRRLLGVIPETKNGY